MDTTTYPKMRSDLVIGAGTSAERTVKDPVADRFYRFGVAESAILDLLTGEHDANQISRLAADQLGGDLPIEVVCAFLDGLEQRDLLVRPDQPREEPTSPVGRVRGSILYLRYAAFDPDETLERWVPHMRPLFTRNFVRFAAGLILLSIGVFIANAAEISRDFGRIVTYSTLPYAWSVVALTTVAHEFAHAITCKHYGGKVRESGFLLIFFQPALYCNVSDAWLMPDKSHRLWVTFAGGFLELVLWALAVLAWRAFEPGAGISFISLVIIGTSGLRIFFNFNPLIKLDGYYLLSDLLDIPNLRAKSLGYVKARARRPFQAADPGICVRERRIYWIYGVLGMAFSVWLILTVAGIGYDFATTRLQGTGFVLFALLLLAVLYRPALNWLRATYRDAHRSVA